MFSYLLNLIPLVIFSIALLATFFLFIAGSIISLSGGDSEKGVKMVANSLFWLVIVVLMFFAFSFMTYIIKKGDIFNPQQITGEFPESPAGSFPPAVGK